MASKRPNKTDKKDSAGRTISVSGNAAAARSDAPPPAIVEDEALLARLSDPDPADLEDLRRELVGHPDPVVRAVYAGSPSLTSNDLYTLSYDVDPVVRSTVAQRWDHPLPNSLLDDPNPVVALAVAGRHDVGSDHRMMLMSRPDVARIAELVMV